MSEGKTNGKRNKAAGHGFERQVVKDLKAIGFPNVCTSRLASRLRDSQKIDVVNEDEDKYGRLPYNIQCKNLAKLADYPKLLDELPQDTSHINVVFHKKTKKTTAGVFRTQGEYAILKLDDFYSMMKKIVELEDDLKSWRQVV